MLLSLLGMQPLHYEVLGLDKQIVSLESDLEAEDIEYEALSYMLCKIKNLIWFSEYLISTPRMVGWYKSNNLLNNLFVQKEKCK